MTRTRRTRFMRAASLAPLAVGIAALLACSEQPTAPTSAPSLGLAERARRSERDGAAAAATLAWQDLTRSLVMANNLGAQPAARVYALVSVAQYGAIHERDDHDEGKRWDNNGRDGRRRSEFERGAVAGASWVVLAFVFPNSAAALQQRVADEQAAAGTPHFSRGVQDGKTMGSRLVEWAKADRFTVPFTGTIPVGPGLWRSSAAPPVGPMFGGTAPYFLRSGDQFRPPPPPAFNSAQFLADLAEIRLLSDTRTPEQLAIAQFWALPAGTPTTPGYWNQVAGDFIEQ